MASSALGSVYVISTTRRSDTRTVPSIGEAFTSTSPSTASASALRCSPDVDALAVAVALGSAVSASPAARLPLPCVGLALLSVSTTEASVSVGTIGSSSAPVSSATGAPPNNSTANSSVSA